MPGVKKLSRGLVADDDFNLVRRDLFIEGARIVAEPDGPVGEVFEASDYIILPGLVNAHLHSNETFLKGLFDHLPTETWALLVYSSPRPVKLTPAQARLRTRLTAAEMLLSGVTTAIDHLYDPGLTEGNLEAAVRGYEEAGLRTVICLGAADIGPEETFPALAGRIRAAKTHLEVLNTCGCLLREFVGRETIKIGLGPTRPQRCTDDLLSGLAELADEYDTVIHTHLLETRRQAFRTRSNLAARLKRLGFSSPRVSYSHCVWNSEAENELIAATGAAVVHNPISNLKLGNGVADVAGFVRRGINVALGTDGAAANDSLSLIEVIKAAGLISQKIEGAPLQPSSILAAATKGGAQSAGLADQSGRLAPGGLADLVLLPLDQPAFTPLNNFVRQMTYCSPKVSHVMVHGEWSVKDGRPSRFDLSSLLEEVNEEWPAVNEQIMTSLKAAEELKALVEPGFRRGLKRLKNLAGLK
ncbi:MAG: amidohydrolase family protein [Thermodesulfobacteriota bacterium]